MSENDVLIYLKKKWKENYETRFKFFFNLSEKENEFSEKIIHACIKSLETTYKEFAFYKDQHFDKEIMSNENGKYDQRLAEMLFFLHLRRIGFTEITSKNEGPDFFAKKNGVNFCFEVVTPTPKENIRELINKTELTTDERNLVFKEKMLAVTSSINRKIEDLDNFIKKGLVDEQDIYIIVVNDSLLLPYNSPWYGVLNNVCISDSSLPVSVDATMGSAAVELDMEMYIDNNKNNGTDNLKKLVVKNNLQIKINDQILNIEDSFLYINVNEKILTRKGTNTIDVDIAESSNASGFYQITLREDIFFLLVLESKRDTLPKTALISKSTQKEMLKSCIPNYGFYCSGEDKIQPPISQAYIIGRDLDEFNNDFIYNDLYSYFIRKKLKKE